MIWVRDAVVANPDQREQPGFQCSGGHISDACAFCSSRNTVRYGNSLLSKQRIISCNGCGNLSAITID
jgi:hypothetical protein